MTSHPRFSIDWESNLHEHALSPGLLSVAVGLFGYNTRMDTFIRNVKDIGTSDRQALEHVIGQHLSEHQQLVIQIVNAHTQQEVAEEASSRAGSLPDWCHVYQGLSDEAISSLEETVLTRADLSRAPN